jgi:pSer/pThr/pTyr-binding forkhead associated (FHA) protein
MSQLRVTSSNLNGAVFVLDGEYFTLGREPDNHIQLTHTSISKHHAILKIDDGDFKLFDLHSTNGIVVNGDQRVVAHLRDGDKIVLGEIELRFEANNKLAATQALSPLPPIPSRPVAPPPPSPTIVAQKAEPKPIPPPVSSPSPKPFTTPVKPRSKLMSLLAGFRRATPTNEPATPATREEIHTELVQTFGKMGLEKPKPPPPKPAIKPHSSLPPPPADLKPKAGRQ